MLTMLSKLKLEGGASAHRPSRLYIESQAMAHILQVHQMRLLGCCCRGAPYRQREF
jgi:hypothetical protein